MGGSGPNPTTDGATSHHRSATQQWEQRRRRFKIMRTHAKEIDYALSHGQGTPKFTTAYIEQRVLWMIDSLEHDAQDAHLMTPLMPLLRKTRFMLHNYGLIPETRELASRLPGVVNAAWHQARFDHLQLLGPMGEDGRRIRCACGSADWRLRDDLLRQPTAHPRWQWECQTCRLRRPVARGRRDGQED